MRSTIRPVLLTLLLAVSATLASAAPDAKPAPSAQTTQAADPASQASAGGSTQPPKVKAGGSGGGKVSNGSAEASAIRPKLPKCPDPSKCKVEAATPAQ